MAKINQNFKKLPKDYLFDEIQKRIKNFSISHPKENLFSLAIGDTVLPLAPAVIRAFEEKIKKLSRIESYTGYGSSQGDIRLRKAISKIYQDRKIKIKPDEIFISDGAKSDCANIGILFSQDNIVAVCDPGYPVYRETNLIYGKKVISLPATEENNFFPPLPSKKADLIFLCSPNNPTGTVATKKQLKEFVDYALKNKAIIIFDAAYSEYVQGKGLLRSIYQIENARKCAIEIQSFSKSAGFTGVRLGWAIVPKELRSENSERGEINKFWKRRQSTMFNGASDIAQEGGLAVLSEKGQIQTKKQIRYYLQNAAIIKKGLKGLGLKVFGGENSPYLWVKCPSGLSSWEFFDKLLNEAKIVVTPGVGFGKYGEGYIRISAFGKRENIKKAIESIKSNLRL